MSKAKNTSSFKRLALKEDLTMIRDMVITVRDQMPDIDKDVPTTPNQRRALRKAILKSLAVWITMHEHSELTMEVKVHRTAAIELMMRKIMEMMRAPVEEDGATAEDKGMQ